MARVDTEELVADLRRSGGERADLEVKSGAGGFPQSLTSTLSALANLPGGGTVVIGLDERRNFAPVRLADVGEVKQALGNKARAYIPPVQLEIEDVEVLGHHIVVAHVVECDPSNKPCRVKSTGRAYLRSHDGDFPLSALEEQAFLAARTTPRFDRAPVDETSTDELDTELTARWLDSVRTHDPAGLGRFSDDDEVLRRAGVVRSDGRLSAAGLLVLGAYPQQYFPRFVVQAAVMPSPDSMPGTRAQNLTTVSGPIPHMLDTALTWARRSFGYRVVDEGDGRVRDVPEYPLTAFREIVANAVIHRDLDAWSAGQAVEVRLRHDRLVVTNPGGLYGITVDRLGKDHVTSARNAVLLNLCRFATLPSDGSRVVEALATGIPRITEELSAAGMPPPVFTDTGIRFTVVLHNTARRPGPTRTEVRAPRIRPGTNLARVYAVLSDAPISAAEIAAETGLSRVSVRKAIRLLRDEHGVVDQQGTQGETATYTRRPPP